MFTTISTLLPVILVIAAGYLIARTGLITDEQWRGVEKLAFYVLFPAVLFRAIYLTDFASFQTLDMGLSLLVAICVMALVLLLVRPALERIWGIQAFRFTSIFQGTLRWNAMIALAIADNIAGAEGLAMLAVAMVVMIPFITIASILVLSRYASGDPPPRSKIAKDLYTNPFIIAIGAGVLA